MAEAGIHLLLDTVDNADAQYQQQKQYFVASMQALVRLLRVPVPVPLSPLPPQTRGRKRAQRTTKQPKQQPQLDGKENLDPVPEWAKVGNLGVCAEGAVDQGKPASEALTAQYAAGTGVCDDKTSEDDDKVNYDQNEHRDEKLDGQANYGQIGDRDGKLEAEPAAGCGETGVEENETEISAHVASGSGYEENEPKTDGDFRAEPSQQLIIDDDDRQKSGNQEAEASASPDVTVHEAGQLDAVPEEQGNQICEPIHAKTEGEAGPTHLPAFPGSASPKASTGVSTYKNVPDTPQRELLENPTALSETEISEALPTTVDREAQVPESATRQEPEVSENLKASRSVKLVSSMRSFMPLQQQPAIPTGPSETEISEALPTTVDREVEVPDECAARQEPEVSENLKASTSVKLVASMRSFLPLQQQPALPTALSEISEALPTTVGREAEVPDESAARQQQPAIPTALSETEISEALPITVDREAEVPDESAARQEPEVSENLKASTSVLLVSSMRSSLPLVEQQQPAIPYANGKKEVRVKALEAAEAARKQEEKRAEERKARKLELQKREISQDLSGVSTRTKRPLELKSKLEQKTRKLEEEQKRKEEEWKKKELELHAKKRKKEEVDKREREDKRRKVDDVNRMRREQEEKLRAELEEKEQRRKIQEEVERERRALEEEIKKQRRLEKEKEIERRRKAEEEAKANWLANKEADRKRKEAYQRMKMLEKEQQRPIEKNPVVVSTINQQNLHEVQRDWSLGLVGQPMRVPKEPSGQRKAVSLSTVKTTFNPKFSMNGTESYLGTPAVKTSLDQRRQLYCTPLLGSDLDDDEEDDDGPTSYEISPYRCSDDEDEETEVRPHKPIPRWASKDKLMARLARQAHVDPDKIFIGASSCSLNEVFGTTGNKKRKDFKERSGSGDWLQDMVTWKEELQYKRSMGYL